MSADDDIQLAKDFLLGRIVRRGTRPVIEYLSDHTKPTEQEARAALARVLIELRTQVSSQDVKQVLMGVVRLFDPSADLSKNRFWNNRTVDIRNISTGHSLPWQDLHIAAEVQIQWESCGNKEKAIKEAADKFGKTTRHVKRIVKKNDVKEMLQQLDVKELLRRLDEMT